MHASQCCPVCCQALITYSITVSRPEQLLMLLPTSITIPMNVRRWMIISVVIGSVLRIAASFGELWLDEMWSLVLASAASSPLDFVFKIRHDNSHILNSLWMWSLPASSPSWLYRLPATVSSIALLMFITQASALAQDTRVRALWCLFCAVSFPFVLLG